MRDYSIVWRLRKAQLSPKYFKLWIYFTLPFLHINTPRKMLRLLISLVRYSSFFEILLKLVHILDCVTENRQFFYIRSTTTRCQRSHQKWQHSMTRAKILVCFPLLLVEIQKQVTRALCTRRTQISPWQVLVVAQDCPSLNLTLPLTQHFWLSLPFFSTVC